MLTRLKDAHAELRTAIAELETETRRHEPDEATLSNARLKLTRTSSRRKALIDQEIFPALRDLSPEQQRRVDELRRTASDVALLSSRHIGDWTMRAILADWPGYRRASQAMRSAMMQRIAEESAILYPLLGGPADGPPARADFTVRYASIPI